MFRKQVLDNGLTILTERMEHVRSVAIGVWISRGSRHERPRESGVAHFIEHMVFKGTETRTQAQIAQELDAIGGQSDAFTSHEYAGFHAKVLGEHLPRAFDLLSDIVLSPRFDPEELERERMVILEEIKGVDDSPEELLQDLFNAQFWPDHPLGRPILGTPETVSRLSRDDLARFFRKTYVPANLIVAAAGDLDHEGFAALVETHFGTLSAPPDGLVETPPEPAMTVRLHEKDLEQAHITLGTVAPPEASPDRFAAYLLNAILGGNLSSRLFQVIREEHGLAYTVYSGLACHRDCGQFSIYAGTDPSHVPELLELTLGEVRRIKEEPVPEDELSRAKDHLRGSILMGLEPTGARMSRLARQEMYFGRYIPPEDVIAAIDAVRPDDVLRLAKEWFDDRPLALTVLGKLGPAARIPERLVA